MSHHLGCAINNSFAAIGQRRKSQGIEGGIQEPLNSMWGHTYCGANSACHRFLCHQARQGFTWVIRSHRVGAVGVSGNPRDGPQQRSGCPDLGPQQLSLLHHITIHSRWWSEHDLLANSFNLANFVATNSMRI